MPHVFGFHLVVRNKITKIKDASFYISTDKCSGCTEDSLAKYVFKLYTKPYYSEMWGATIFNFQLSTEHAFPLWPTDGNMEIELVVNGKTIIPRQKRNDMGYFTEVAMFLGSPEITTPV